MYVISFPLNCKPHGKGIQSIVMYFLQYFPSHYKQVAFIIEADGNKMYEIPIRWDSLQCNVVNLIPTYSLYNGCTMTHLIPLWYVCVCVGALKVFHDT